MNSNRPSKSNLPNVPKSSKLLAPTRLRRTYFFYSFPDSATWPQYQPIWNWFLPNYFPKHQTALSQEWIWWENVLVMSLSRIWQWRGREQRNLKSLLGKDCGWVNLVFFRVSLKNSLWKLSLNCGYKGIYIVGWEGMWKVIFCQTGCFSDLTLRLGWVVSSSREQTAWPA